MNTKASMVKSNSSRMLDWDQEKKMTSKEHKNASKSSQVCKYINQCPPGMFETSLCLFQ